MNEPLIFQYPLHVVFALSFGLLIVHYVGIPAIPLQQGDPAQPFIWAQHYTAKSSTQSLLRMTYGSG